jgi:hypothetical protein
VGRVGSIAIVVLRVRGSIEQPSNKRAGDAAVAAMSRSAAARAATPHRDSGASQIR